MSNREKKMDHHQLKNKNQKGGGKGKAEHIDEQKSRGKLDIFKDKQTTLRGAKIIDMHTYRPRAGTVGSRKDTFLSVGSKDKHFQGKDQDRQSQETDDHQPLEYENTYKMEPDVKFQERQVKDIITAVLKENITEKEYSHNALNRRITLMCSNILERVKRLDMKRYKLISHVLIGENNSTTLQFSSRCLWDIRWDTFASVTITSGNIYATGMVFGIYAE